MSALGVSGTVFWTFVCLYFVVLSFVSFCLWMARRQSREDSA